MVALPAFPRRPRSSAAIAGFAWRRMRANWPWAAALALGMLAAATLLAIAPTYHRAIVDLGLRDAIAENHVAPTDAAGLYPYDDASIREPQVGLIRVEFAGVDVTGADAEAFGERIRGEIVQQLGWLATGYGSYERVGGVFVSRPGEINRPFADGYVQTLPGWQQRVTLLDGRLPAEEVRDGIFEVVINERGAQLSGLKVGDRFELIPPCAGGLAECTPAPTTVTAEVTGIAEPVVPDDAFWAAGSAQYFEPYFVERNPGLILPLLMAEAPFARFREGLPEGTSGYRAWYAFTDPDGLSRGVVNRALERVKEVERTVQSPQGLAFSPIAFTVREFEREADHQRAPLTILLLEISAIALFYLVLVGAAAMERQGREIALLRSRGTSALQVLGSHMAEALLIAAVVALVAPFLAMGAVSSLGTFPVFHDVTGGDPLDVTLLPSAFLLAAGGALLGVGAVFLPALAASRRGIVAQRQVEARPTRSFFQRYYLDVILTGMALLLLWELHERGSVYEPSATGGVTSDPLLLAAPALLVFAGAMTFLRFYPLALRGLARLAVRGPGVSPVMGLSHLERRPGQYAQLALLLLIAVAIGTFAASYSATTERSLEDRAAFKAGVDWRATAGKSANLGSHGSRIDTELRKLPAQTNASAVLRTEAGLSLVSLGDRNFQLLAVDPDAAASMLWFRDDFADSALESLLEPLQPSGELPGLALPVGSTRFSAWIWTPEPRELTTIWARFEDAHGETDLVELGVLDFFGWRELAGDITASADPSAAPLRLTAIILSSPSTRGFVGSNTGILFDDFTVTAEGGKATIVEDFESVTPRWQALIASAVNPDVLSQTTDQKHGGLRAAKLALGPGTTGGLRGIFPAADRVPLPIVASESLLGELGLKEGGRAVVLVGGTPVPVEIRSSYRLFPTLPSEDGSSAVISRDDLNGWLRTWAIGDRVEMNEVWFELPDGASIESRRELERAVESDPYRLDQVTDREALLAEIDDDPLVAAGGAGILTVGFGATLVLLAAACVVVLFTGAERRKGELAVMRALGFSRGQVARMLALEYGLLIALGLVLGAILGRQLGDRMLSFLNVTEDGEKVEPGFILETDWALLGVSGAIIVVIFAVVLGLTLWFARRVSTAQSLRVE